MEEKELRKQLKKQSIKTLLYGFVLLFVLIFASYAWFANSKKVTSGEMAILSDTSPNLIISDDENQLKNIDTSAGFTVNFSPLKEGARMIATTHDWSVGTATGLKYNTNPEAVGYASGNKRGETELTFAGVPEANDKKYYFDCVVYLASSRKELLTSDLYATFENADSDELKSYLNACSVDFYLGDVSESSFRGTLNIAGQGKDTSKVSIMNGAVPKAGETPIKITMRFYFDGALQNEENPSRAYINSQDVSTSGVSVRVNFRAEE